MSVRQFMYILLVVYLIILVIVLITSDAMSSPATKWFLLTLGGLGILAAILDKLIRRKGK